MMKFLRFPNYSRFRKTEQFSYFIEQCLKLKNNAKSNISNFDGLFVRYSMVMVSNFSVKKKI